MIFQVIMHFLLSIQTRNITKYQNQTQLPKPNNKKSNNHRHIHAKIGLSQEQHKGSMLGKKLLFFKRSGLHASAIKVRTIAKGNSQKPTGTKRREALENEISTKHWQSGHPKVRMPPPLQAIDTLDVLCVAFRTDNGNPLCPRLGPICGHTKGVCRENKKR